MTRLPILCVLLAAGTAAAQTDSTVVALDVVADTSASGDLVVLTNAEISSQYLASVAAQPGVERSRSGLLWTVERRGGGMRPTRADVVLVEYVGRLPDGTVFDRSPERDPLRMPVRAAVPGLAEALLDMRTGERRTVYVPPGLGYGAGGVVSPAGEVRIPPAAVLVFDVRVVRIVR